MGKPTNPPNKLTIDQINEKLIKIDGCRLTAISFAEPGITKKGWEIRKCLCICICGKEKPIKIGSITTGVVRSCGCLNDETRRRYRFNTIHIRYIYQNMISRCYDVENTRYKGYGDQGVIVCEEWRNSFHAFLKWCIENGWRKGLQLDKDIRGDGKLYSPETCKFVTRQENMMHIKKAFKVEYKGEIVKFRVLCHELGFTAAQYKTIYNRVKFFKWSVERALTQPLPLKKCGSGG